VTGSFDKTIRIFRVNEGKSREVYHTQRMQKVYSVLFTQDDRYVISGSEDLNIRFWKSHANDAIKLVLCFNISLMLEKNSIEIIIRSWLRNISMHRR
jgi:WD40 repeat protein